MIGTQLGIDVPFVGKSVKEAASIFPDVHFMPIAVQRKELKPAIIPRGDTVLKQETQFFLSLYKRGLRRFKNFREKAISQLKNSMILGGSKIGVNTARSSAIKSSGDFIRAKQLKSDGNFRGIARLDGYSRRWKKF